MEKKKNYWAWNALLLVAVLGLTIWSIAKEQNFAMLPEAFARMHKGYLLLSAALGILYVLCESFILKVMFWREGRRVRFMDCGRYSFIGFFFSAITPSATGGQPVEIYYMNRDGIPAATATPMLMITTILYKIVLVLSGLMFLLVGQGVLTGLLANSGWLFALGFVINFIFIAVVLLLFYRPVLVGRFIAWLFSLRLLRRHGRLRDKALDFAGQYRSTCDFYGNKWKDALVWLTISLFQRAILLAVTYLVYRSFGLEGYNIAQIMLLQGVIAISVDMLPLPGGMGASEHLFLEIFLPVFGSDLVLSGALATRVLTFYLPLVISGAVVVISHFRAKKEKI